MRRPAFNLIYILSGNFFSCTAQGTLLFAISSALITQKLTTSYVGYYAMTTCIASIVVLYSGKFADYFNKKSLVIGLNIFAAIFLLTQIYLPVGNKLGTAISLLTFIFLFIFHYIYQPLVYSFVQEKNYDSKNFSIGSGIELSTQLAAVASIILNLIIYHIEEDGGKIMFYLVGISFGFFLMASFLYALVGGPFFKIEKTPNLNNGFIELIKIFQAIPGLYYNTLGYVFISFAVFVGSVIMIPLFITNNKLYGLSTSEILIIAGSLCCGFIFVTSIRRKVMQRIKLLFFIICITLLIFLMYADFKLICVFSFLIGFLTSLSKIFRADYILANVPEKFSGRVNGLILFFNNVLRMLFSAVLYIFLSFDYIKLNHVLYIVTFLIILCGTALFKWQKNFKPSIVNN